MELKFFSPKFFHARPTLAFCPSLEAKYRWRGPDFLTLYEEELSVIEDVEEAASDSSTLPFWPMPQWGIAPSMPHDAPCPKMPQDASPPVTSRQSFLDALASLESMLAVSNTSYFLVSE